MAGGCEGLTGRVIRAIKVARSVIEGSRRWGRRQPVASLFTRGTVHGSCAYINWLSLTRHRGGYNAPRLCRGVLHIRPASLVSRWSRDEGLFVIAVVELNFALFFPENSEHESNEHLFIAEREERRRGWSSVCAIFCPDFNSSSDYPRR